MTEDELPWCSLVELGQLLARRTLSAVELLESTLARIGQVDRLVNAVVSLDIDGATTAARAVDAEVAAGVEGGPLRGIPIAVKDLEDVAGIRTTYGSRTYEHHVPAEDGLLAARLRAAGMVIIGKTNTPEFGTGSQTFNEVFGTTRNPYDLAATAGGSSGGAAAAVASGMLPVADGSDYAASVRNPASFCNVVGLRPSPGRWPDVSSGGDDWDPLPVLGPIARSVPDLALFFSTLCQDDPRAPLSHAQDVGELDVQRPPDVQGLRIAWSPDLGGLPIDPRVRRVLDGVPPVLQSLGCTVVETEPDLRRADRAFETLRGLAYLRDFETAVGNGSSGALKDTIRWNFLQGVRLSAHDVADALRARTGLFHEMRTFLCDIDVLALPASQLPPFAADVEWPRVIDGVPQANYLEWMRSCSRITMTSHPAIAVPAGFTPEGLPVGLQLVGRYRDEASLLRVARAFEAATGHGSVRPALTGPDGPGLRRAGA
jgi:amidase